MEKYVVQMLLTADDGRQRTKDSGQRGKIQGTRDEGQRNEGQQTCRTARQAGHLANHEEGKTGKKPRRG